MPRNWLYFIALILPLVLRLLLYTNLIDWFWYEGHADAYYALIALRANPAFEFIGGWPLLMFVITIIGYWMMDGNGDGIAHQFLLLPLGFVPFSVVGGWLVNGAVNVSDIYIHPLVIIPIGYAYVFAWAAFVWTMDKFRLVI